MTYLVIAFLVVGFMNMMLKPCVQSGCVLGTDVSIRSMQNLTLHSARMIAHVHVRGCAQPQLLCLTEP
jgi:hypothetical protein